VGGGVGGGVGVGMCGILFLGFVGGGDCIFVWG